MPEQLKVRTLHAGIAEPNYERRWSEVQTSNAEPPVTHTSTDEICAQNVLVTQQEGSRRSLSFKYRYQNFAMSSTE
jgi:hypothetical protein